MRVGLYRFQCQLVGFFSVFSPPPFSEDLSSYHVSEKILKLHPARREDELKQLF